MVDAITLLLLLPSLVIEVQTGAEAGALPSGVFTWLGILLLAVGVIVNSETTTTTMMISVWIVMAVG